MGKETRADILGCHVDLLDFNGVIEKIKSFIAGQLPRQVITLNAEIVYAASSNQDLKDIINKADLVTPDGIGIVWGARQLGYQVKERVTGIDLLHRLCREAAAAGWRIYLFGAAPGVAELAASELARLYPGLQIVGTRDGYFHDWENDRIIGEIRAREPHILFAALGAPKQEMWIRDNLDKLGVPLCMGVGGSFDVVAGMKKRAPRWMISLNLEWLYRLAAEPSRIKRQLVLPKFVVMIIREKYR